MNTTLLIMAGGTGGHIMPGLAIAEAMRSRGWSIRWLGTAHGMETRLVPAAGIPLDTVTFGGMRGKGLWHSVRGAWQLLGALRKSLALVRSCRPGIVLGMGGYVTVPGGLAARMLTYPLVLLNADARLLLSNRVLAPLARQVCYGLPPARALKRFEVFTGAPVRAEIAAIAAPAERFSGRSGPLKLMIVGGSLGAAVLNRVVPEAIAALPAASRPEILHQAGALHQDSLSARYQGLGIKAEVVPFIDDMAKRYAECDLILCRSGAITVCELAAAGVASILVPLAVSTTSHQRDNAEVMVKAGAALMLDQRQLDARSLSELLLGLDRTQLVAMAKNARKLGRPDATERVVQLILAAAQGAAQP